MEASLLHSPGSVMVTGVTATPVTNCAVEGAQLIGARFGRCGRMAAKRWLLRHGGTAR